MTTTSLKTIGLLIALAMLSAHSAQAAGEPELISTHGNWSAYVYEENGGKVCFMSSQPAKSEGAYTRRDEVFAMITHRPADKSRDVVSFIAGYAYKDGSEVKMDIDGTSTTLFSQDGSAWAADTATDKALAQAIQKGGRMVVKGTSARGTATTDTFDLTGSGAAYKAISDACGIK